MPKRFLPAVAFLGSLLVLALNLFWLGPWLDARFQGFVANLTYVGVRLAVVFGLPYFLVRVLKRPQFRAVATAAFAIVIDQVIFKGGYLILNSPQPLTPDERTNLVLASLFSLVIALPVVLLIAMAGAVSGQWGARKEPQDRSIL